TLARKLLAAGIGKGTRVGGLFGFGPRWLVAWLAVTRIGALFLPFSTRSSPPDLVRFFGRATAAPCLRRGACRGFAAWPWPGTTSAPKGVVHTHGAMVRHGRDCARFIDLGPDDRMYCGMPLFWVGGIAFSVMACMHVGATMLGMEKFDAAGALDLMERQQCT